MDGESGWWNTSGNIGLPSLARVMGVGRQQQHVYIKQFIILILCFRSFKVETICGGDRLVTNVGYHYLRKANKWLHHFCIDLLLILTFIASLPLYLLCQFLKSEADIVEVTVMEVFRDKSVRRARAGSKSVSDRLFYGRNIEINNGHDHHLSRQQVNSLHHLKYCI